MAPSRLAILALIFLCTSWASQAAKLGQREDPQPYVGFNIGTDVSDLVPPKKLVSFLQSQKITHVRLYDADNEILRALSMTKIRVIVSVPNNQLLAIGSSKAAASLWVKTNVLAFYPNTSITGIAVGDEVLSALPSSASLLLPVMESLYSSLLSAKLHQRIKISSPHSSSIILNPFPPSQSFFNQTWAPTLLPFLRFLSKTSSPFMINLYPYYVFMQNSHVVPIDSALFKPISPANQMVDPNTLFHYTNVYDAMIDSVYYCMRNLNISDVLVLVTESGWPSKGDPKEPRATKENAVAYNSNLIKHVLEKSGTPLHPEVTSSVYLYELFNEDLRSSPVSEANWGLFYGNLSPVYLLHLSGTGTFLGRDSDNVTYCVTEENADLKTLQAALDWACGPGGANCTEIQPGQKCFSPNDVKFHASYAFDSYYQMHYRASGSCDFNGIAMVTTSDPSQGRCVFPGNEPVGNKTMAIGNTSIVSNGCVKFRVYDLGEFLGALISVGLVLFVDSLI